MDHDMRVRVSQVCSTLNVDGLRGDIVTNRAARAYAAYQGRDEVTVDDIGRVITLALKHRLRKDPLQQVESGDKVMKVFREVFELEEQDEDED